MKSWESRDFWRFSVEWFVERDDKRNLRLLVAGVETHDGDVLAGVAILGVALVVYFRTGK